jgi:hypothetical protein
MFRHLDNKATSVLNTLVASNSLVFAALAANAVEVLKNAQYALPLWLCALISPA